LQDAFSRFDFEAVKQGEEPKKESFELGVFVAVCSVSIIAALWSYDGILYSFPLTVGPFLTLKNFFSLQGWGDLNSVGEELQNPQRNGTRNPRRDCGGDGDLLVH